MTGQAPQAHAFPASAEDPAIIIYTSGTTGDPKGAELTHANVMMNAYVIRDLVQYRPDDVSLLVLPLFHIFGLVAQLMAGVLAGVTNVLMARFDPEAVIQHMDKEKVSVFCGAPTMYWALLHHQSPTIHGFRGNRLAAALLYFGGPIDARRDAARIRGALPHYGPRRLRHVGNVAGDQLQSPRHGA